MSETSLDRTKFAELVLYAAYRCTDDPEFGAIKMAKILWRSDTIFYANYGRSITGAEYQRLEFGPAARAYRPVERELIKANDAAVAVQRIHGYRSTRLVAIREPNLNVFSHEEIAIIDAVIEDVKKKTATQVSDETHGIVWELSQPGETIPYSAVLVSDIPLHLSAREKACADDLAGRIDEAG